MAKIKVYTVFPGVGCAPFTEKDPTSIITWMEEATPGDVMKINIGEMEESEYNKMPEYMGP